MKNPKIISTNSIYNLSEREQVHLLQSLLNEYGDNLILDWFHVEDEYIGIYYYENNVEKFHKFRYNELNLLLNKSDKW